MPRTSESVSTPAPRTRKRPIDFADLLLLVVGSGLLIWVSDHSVHEVVRMVLGIAMGGLGSGYAVTLVAFPLPDLKPEERFGLGIILSIAIIVLTSLVMSELHIRILSEDLTLVVGITSLLAALGATMRRWWSSGSLKHTRVDPKMSFLAAALAIGVGVLTWFIVTPSLTTEAPSFFVTALNNLQNAYPSTVIRGSTHQVMLHIGESPGNSSRYRMVIRDNGRRISTQSVTVGTQWSRVYAIPTGKIGKHKLTFVLFAKGPRPFRTLWLYYFVVNKPGPNPT